VGLVFHVDPVAHDARVPVLPHRLLGHAAGVPEIEVRPDVPRRTHPPQLERRDLTARERDHVRALERESDAGVLEPLRLPRRHLIRPDLALMI
jgi:hypothetical protein